MSKFKLNNSHENITPIKLFLNFFIKLGNIIIICFGIIIFSVRKLLFKITKEKNEQTLIEYVDDLEKRLNLSSSQFIQKNNRRSFVQDNNKDKKMQQTEKNKTFSKKKSTANVISKKQILYISSGVVIVAVFILIGIFITNGDRKKIAAKASIPASMVNSSKDLSNNTNTRKNSYTAKEEILMNGPDVSSILNIDRNNLKEVQILDSASATATIPPNTDVPTTTVSPTELDSQILIHLNDTHKEVAKIQEYLMDLHYMDADEPTTLYGVVTNYAMQLFQRGHGLSVDGIAGIDTLKLLYSDEVKPYMVREGDYGTDIAKIKERLEELGYLSSSDSGKRFDDDTDLAIRVFQGRNKLSQDGIVGYNTTQVLFNGDARPARSSNSNTSGGGSSSSGSSSGGSSGSSYNAADAASLVGFAKSLLNQGIPYVWGGKTRAGLDCSGFVYYCLNNSGYSTGYRTSSAWASSSFTTISSMSDLKPGDILCFAGHVGIYIGDGKMIDSSSSENGIRITNFKSSNYWNRKWIHGKRVFT